MAEAGRTGLDERFLKIEDEEEGLLMAIGEGILCPGQDQQQTANTKIPLVTRPRGVGISTAFPFFSPFGTPSDFPCLVSSRPRPPCRLSTHRRSPQSHVQRPAYSLAGSRSRFGPHPRHHNLVIPFVGIRHGDLPSAIRKQARRYLLFYRRSSDIKFTFTVLSY